MQLVLILPKDKCVHAIYQIIAVMRYYAYMHAINPVYLFKVADVVPCFIYFILHLINNATFFLFNLHIL